MLPSISYIHFIDTSITLYARSAYNKVTISGLCKNTDDRPFVKKY